MASEYRCGFSNELEFSLINYLSKMLCDSNRRLSNTRITARCQIIYFPLVFPAPEVLNTTARTIFLYHHQFHVQSLKWLPLHVGSKALLLHGLVSAFVWPHFLPLTPPFSFLTGIPGFPWTGTPGSGPASVPTHRLFSSLGQPFLSYFTSRSLLS